MVTTDVIEVESFMCECHAYMQEWTPFIGEKLECKRERKQMSKIIML